MLKFSHDEGETKNKKQKQKQKNKKLKKRQSKMGPRHTTAWKRNVRGLFQTLESWMWRSCIHPCIREEPVGVVLNFEKQKSVDFCQPGRAGEWYQLPNCFSLMFYIPGSHSTISSGSATWAATISPSSRGDGLDGTSQSHRYVLVRLLLLPPLQLIVWLGFCTFYFLIFILLWFSRTIRGHNLSRYHVQDFEPIYIMIFFFYSHDLLLWFF